MTGWGVADAKQRLSEVLRAAGETPQVIRNRSEPVAVVVDVGLFRRFESWLAQESGSLAEVTAELRDICAAEGYELAVPPREDRANPFAGAG